MVKNKIFFGKKNYISSKCYVKKKGELLQEINVMGFAYVNERR